MPITRSGRPVAAASDEIGIDDVFEASTASAGNSTSALRNTSSLTTGSSTTASIIRSAATSSIDGSDAAEHLVGIGPALLGQSRQALAHRAEPALDRARRGVVERHTAAGARDDLSDPAAHLACADDEDVLERHAREASAVNAYRA